MEQIFIIFIIFIRMIIQAVHLVGLHVLVGYELCLHSWRLPSFILFLVFN